MRSFTLGLFLLASIPGLLLAWLPCECRDPSVDRQGSVASAEIAPDLVACETSAGGSHRCDEVRGRCDLNQESGLLARSVLALQLAGDNHDHCSTHALHWQFGAPRDASATIVEHTHVCLQV
jgi:hypothetical protein